MRSKTVYGAAVIAAAAIGAVVALTAASVARTSAPGATHLTGARRVPAPDGPAVVAGRSTTGVRSTIIGRSMLAPPIPCGQDQTVWGYLGLVRPGEAAAARQGLGGAVLAQVTDHATGQVLDLTRKPASVAAIARWLPAYPQDTQPQLLSCDYMLTDLRLTAAAMTAFVRAGYFRSVSQLRSGLQVMFVSPDPAARGEVLVTLDFTGPADNPPVPKGAKPGKHPTFYSLVSYTAIEQQASANVTGLAPGGF